MGLFRIDLTLIDEMGGNMKNFLDGFFLIEENEGEASRSSSRHIVFNRHIFDRSELREIFLQIFFADLRRQLSDEQFPFVVGFRHFPILDSWRNSLCLRLRCRRLRRLFFPVVGFTLKHSCCVDQSVSRSHLESEVERRNYPQGQREKTSSKHSKVN